MKQAILITAYKNVHQLKDLIQAFDQNYYFFIHIDRKSSISQSEIADLTEIKNVIYISQQYKVKWGGFDHLQAILLLLRMAFENPKIEYFHLITGQDYPIKSPADIDSFLSNNRKEYLEYQKLPYEKWTNGGMDRLSYYNLYDIINGREGMGRFVILKIKKIQQILGFRRGFSDDFPVLYGGGTYWTLSRDCISYVFGYMREHPNYLQRFKYSFCGEEIFFQTIILNSPFKDRVVNDHLRFIVWDVSRDSFPANLDDRDEESLFASNALFARKFELPVSKNLLEKIKIKLNKR